MARTPRSVLSCLVVCTSPQIFTPDIYFGYNTPGVSLHVWRCAQIHIFLLRTYTLDESIYECSSISRDVHMSANLDYEIWNLDMYTRGIVPGVIQCAHIQIFYSGNVHWRNHSYSVAMCPDILLQICSTLVETTIQDCSINLLVLLFLLCNP
jgi:hypothetical protein